MRSLKELYRIGKGPSSSHTIGPERACKLFLAENSSADAFTVRLFGSLAKTGKGHGTDRAIAETLAFVKSEVIFDCESGGIPHRHCMDILIAEKPDENGYAGPLAGRK